jgi:biopolymer transport protein TolQ
MQEVSHLLLAAAQRHDTWSLIKAASPVVQGVMFLLLLMFLGCCYIMIFKGLYIMRATRETNHFTESFWRSKDIEQIYRIAQALRHSPVSAMFLAGYTELAKLADDGQPKEDDLDNIVRSLRKAQLAETLRMEALIPFLATTGSSAPFIGLFGTVWGIMNSFTAIADKGSATIPDVAPGLAEALIATAFGLVAAIPAVMAYNFYQRKIQIQVSTMETFEKDFLNIVKRHFLK